MQNVDVKLFGNHVCGWGEGLCWNPDAVQLHFVDCMKNVVGQVSLDAPEDLRLIQTPSMPTKVLLSNKSNQVLVVLDDGIYEVTSGDIGTSPLMAMPEGSSSRFNDATVDTKGRILTGNLGLEANTAGAFWTWQKDKLSGSWSVLASKKGNANGPCFSEDGQTLYFGDTPTGNVLCYDYDQETGVASMESVFSNTFELGGVPDGAALDNEGCLWVAIYGGGVIARYTPGGTLDGTVKLPVRNPTDVIFAGPKYDRMIVTSSIEQPDDEGKTSELAGAMFEIEGAGVNGLSIGKVSI